MPYQLIGKWQSPHATQNHTHMHYIVQCYQICMSLTVIHEGIIDLNHWCQALSAVELYTSTSFPKHCLTLDWLVIVQKYIHVSNHIYMCMVVTICITHWSYTLTSWFGFSCCQWVMSSLLLAWMRGLDIAFGKTSQRLPTEVRAPDPQCNVVLHNFFLACL